MEQANGVKDVSMNPMNTNNLIPIILMGGYSTRMKQDKAFLKWNDTLWFEIIYNKLKLYFENIYLSMRLNQYEMHYKELKLYNENNLIIFDEPIKIEGPLKGMISTLLFFEDKITDFFLSQQI